MAKYIQRSPPIGPGRRAGTRSVWSLFHAVPVTGDDRNRTRCFERKDKEANGLPQSGVWFTDDDSALRLAVKEGDVMQGRGGRIRTVRILEAVSDSAAQLRSINVRGEMIYR
jgi:hypothetical protein